MAGNRCLPLPEARAANQRQGAGHHGNPEAPQGGPYDVLSIFDCETALRIFCLAMTFLFDENLGMLDILLKNQGLASTYTLGSKIMVH